jgi:hypothetical protein
MRSRDWNKWLNVPRHDDQYGGKIMPTSILFYILWIVAFIGFPLGGVASQLLVGPVESPLRGAFAGLITGAVIGLAQWLVLQRAIALPVGWVLGTAAGMAVGMATGIAFFGTSPEGNGLLVRALLTGLAIGVVQWLILRPSIPASGWWVGVIAIGWAAGWFVTRAVGVDLTWQWSVFGSSGALVFQLITALTLWRLLP